MIGIVSINIQAQKKISTNLVGGYEIKSGKDIYEILTKNILPEKTQYEKQSVYDLKIDSIKKSKDYLNIYNEEYHVKISLENYFNDKCGFNMNLKLPYDAESEIFTTPSNPNNKCLYDYGLITINNDLNKSKFDKYSFNNYIIKSTWDYESSKYEATNAYGATVIVDKVHSFKYYLIDNNNFYDKLCNLKIKYDINNANKLDNDVELIITFKNILGSNLINIYHHSEPTIKSPNDYTSINYYIPVNISQIDFYDKTTKKIIYTVK